MEGIINVEGRGVEGALSDMQRSQACKEEFEAMVKKYSCAYVPNFQVDPNTLTFRFTGLTFIAMNIVKL